MKGPGANTIRAAGFDDPTSVLFQVGPEVHYTFIDEGTLRPWVGLGLGVDALMVGAKRNGVRYSESYTAFAPFHPMVGVDWLISKGFGLGIYMDWQIRDMAACTLLLHRRTIPPRPTTRVLPTRSSPTSRSPTPPFTSGSAWAPARSSFRDWVNCTEPRGTHRLRVLSCAQNGARFSGRTSDRLIEAVSGTRPGYRRAHARGLVLAGTFQASAEARAFTRAEHFQGAPVPVQVRLSNAGGNPFGSDRESDKVGRALGLAVRFLLPSGKIASWAAVNLPAFPARTPDDFVEVTAAQKPFLSMKPNPFKIIAYLVRRPSVLPAIKAIATMKPAQSFATTAFNSIHTYFLVNDQGTRQPARYSWLPCAGSATLGPDESRARPRLYLLDEIRTRLATGPVEWDLVFQFPEASDPLDDASRAWPAGRRTCRAGKLMLTGIEPDQRATEGLVFDPTNVVPGIELSDDPLLRFRAEAYSESYRRRSQETRAEPPPPDMGQ